MTILFDIEDDMPVAVIARPVDLKEAVELYLKQQGYWDDPGYWYNKRTLKSLSGREMVESGAYFRFFRAHIVPAIP